MYDHAPANQILAPSLNEVFESSQKRMQAFVALFLLFLSGCDSFLQGSLLLGTKLSRWKTRSRGTSATPARKFKSAMNPDLIHAINIISNLDDMVDHSRMVLIGTHDGAFHCDEAVAISLLNLVPQFSSNCVIRSRNPEVLQRCDILVDVGSVYDPTTHRYDHHQRSFADTFDGFNTKLSSAGLIYRHFGRAIIESLLNKGTEEFSPEEKNTLVDICYQKLYRSFIEHIDAIDNGVSSAESGEIKCHMSTSLSARVGQLNPRWNQPQNNTIQNEQFAEALTLTRNEFLTNADEIVNSWYPARSIVHQAVKKRFSSVDADGYPVYAIDGRIMILEQFCPWKDHLYEIEQQENLAPILYVLFPDTSGSWRVQAVPEVWSSFQSRKALPLIWCGLKDAELSQEVGIAGCKFVHTTGFIGGHETREGAIAMAIKALDM